MGDVKDAIDFFYSAMKINIKTFKEKIERLDLLYKSGYKDEALTLCCIYIESLPKLFKMNDKHGRSEETFTKTLINFGGNDIFKKISLRRLLNKLNEGGTCHIYEKAKEYFKNLEYDIAINAWINKKVGDPPEQLKMILEEHEIINFIEMDLKKSAHAIKLSSCLWKGTVANACYNIRCGLVHQGIADHIMVEEVPLDFTLLYKALNSIFDSLGKEEDVERWLEGFLKGSP